MLFCSQDGCHIFLSADQRSEMLVMVQVVRNDGDNPIPSQGSQPPPEPSECMRVNLLVSFLNEGIAG
jgi:hypothetical protein